MYGTIATFRVKQGKEQALKELMRTATTEVPGVIFECVFKSDKDPRIFSIVVGFESREAYRKNAESPEQHQRYLQYRELLETEPEWNDGEVVYTDVRAMAAS
jgi:quinol monooxygenase YgiN